MAALKRHHSTKQVEVWAEDEARLGLKPITKRTWWIKGRRPVIEQHRRYQWLHVYGFVRPSTGQSEYLLLPFVNTAAMQVALNEFAKYVNPKDDKIIVLLVDRAGWHQTRVLNIPAGIRLFPLPPYTPELQPVERVWPLLRESVANRPIHTLDKLERLLVKRCRYLLENPKMLQQHVGFGWIINAEGRGS